MAIIITEEQLSALRDALSMTEYKFMSNIRQFLSDLLGDPINAPVPALLAAHNLGDRSGLIKTLCDKGILVKKERLSDKMADGSPKEVSMIVSYNVPKKDFNKKLRRLYSELYDPYTIPTEDANNELDEMDSGGATNASSSGAFEAPLFSPIKRKIK